MTWYYILAIISFGIFFLQGILSWLGADLDFDIDFDGVTDFSSSDIFAFKGLIHFLMGFSGYLSVASYFNTSITIYSIGIGILIGIAFMIILYFTYKFCLQLNHETTSKITADIVGQSATVYLVSKTGPTNIYYITIGVNGCTQELVAYSEIVYKKGDTVTVKHYIDNKIII